MQEAINQGEKKYQKFFNQDKQQFTKQKNILYQTIFQDIYPTCPIQSAFQQQSDTELLEQSFIKFKNELTYFKKHKSQPNIYLQKDFQQCFQICHLVWLNKKIKLEQIRSCSWMCLLLIQSLIYRKFRACILLNQPGKIVQSLNQLQYTNIKRKDELIKQGLNLVLNVFAKINKKQPNFYQYFYEKYLKKYINKNEYQKYFYINKYNPDKIYIRKVNRILIKLLSQNKNLKMVIEDLDHIGVHQYQNKIYKQLQKVVLNLQNKLSQSKNKDDFLNQLSLFEKGSQTDIPWTIFEIKKAISYLKSNILEY